MPSQIRRFKIDRFRGIEALTWYPMAGVNIILGGGDVGKTTILDAIALLLNPTNTYTVMDADYFRRDVEHEFVIEAVMSLPDVPAMSQQARMNWLWEWNGEEAVLPCEDDVNESAQETSSDPVYVLRVRGTAELELVHEIVQPNSSADGLSVGLRRAIGLVRLGGDDRNDRDLRLVQGSALDRLLSDKGLRSRLGHELAVEDVKQQLKQEGQTALSDLETSFGRRALPTNLGLGITGGPGISLNALVGLTADKDDVTLPLASWGAGTRRLAALTIADALQGERPITVVDEIEKGLEPYRQRTLIRNLVDGGAQVFITTHSASALAAASNAALWYLDSRATIGRLPNERIARHQKLDPDAFLARLTVVCEGDTEVGFVSFLMSKALGDFVEQGVWITNGGGHESSLGLLEALAAGGLSFAGLVDNEKKWPERWARIKQSLGNLLLQWSDGCLEQQIIPLFEPTDLPNVVEDPEGTYTRMRLRSLAERLEIEEADIERIKEIANDSLAQLIIEAATGSIPEKFAETEKHIRNRFKGDARIWFKSPEGGRELAEKVLKFGAWTKLKPTVLPFLNAIRETVGLAAIEDLSE
jgi:putative ATP-dependent endonuclease of OLD family